MSGVPAGRVVVLGSLSQDLHLAVARHPSPGETVIADGGVARGHGGKGANQALAAASAGAGVVMVGRVGHDGPGRAYRERLADRGVDVSLLGTDPEAPTGTAVVVTDASGENVIVVAPGANGRVGDDELAGLRGAGGLGAGDVLLATLEIPPGVVAAAARLAAGRGARVVVNLAPYAALPADVLALCDPVVVNEHEHALLLGDLAEGAGPASLLVTTGAGGSRWGEEHVAAQEADVVDTTGAGDAYCGALAAALCAGAGRREAMVVATAAAAACVAHPGAQPA